jgi:hypothetical protein
MSVIPTLQRLRQDGEFKANETMSQKRKKKTNKGKK